MDEDRAPSPTNQVRVLRYAITVRAKQDLSLWVSNELNSVRPTLTAKSRLAGKLTLCPVFILRKISVNL
jgi:hypothetical protein